jgi:hypothetical protein
LRFALIIYEIAGAKVIFIFLSPNFLLFFLAGVLPAPQALRRSESPPPLRGG